MVPIFLITTPSVLILYLVHHHMPLSAIKRLYRPISPKVNWDKVSPEQFSRYNNFVANNLPHLSPSIISCTDPTCRAHLPEIDSFLISFQQCLTFASQSSFTYLNSSTTRKKQKTIPGWNDAARSLKSQANFGIKCGSKLVVLVLVYFILSRSQVSQGLSTRQRP